MAVVTIQRLAEQAMNLIEGGSGAAASSVSYNELKIVCGQVINSLLRTEYFSTNVKMGETIDNGSMLAYYEDIEVVSSNGKSQATLPIKPIKLPRNMGIFGVYPKYETHDNYAYDKELIPLQMGQAGLLKSQSLINDLLGQVGYENFNDKLIFTKDIKALYPDVKLAMRLAILDISQYGDWDALPVLPEMEIEIINQVYKLYSSQVIADKVVDSTSKEEKGNPIKQQSQS